MTTRETKKWIQRKPDKEVFSKCTCRIGFRPITYFVFFEWVLGVLDFEFIYYLLNLDIKKLTTKVSIKNDPNTLKPYNPWKTYSVYASAIEIEENFIIMGTW